MLEAWERPFVTQFEKTYHYPNYSKLPVKTESHPDGNIIALDSKSGKYLWHYQLGVGLRSTGGTTYMVDGKQYLLVPSGSALTAFALP